MPFKSKEQERYLQINEPEIYQDWVEKYGRFKGAESFNAENEKRSKYMDYIYDMFYTPDSDAYKLREIRYPKLKGQEHQIASQVRNAFDKRQSPFDSVLHNNLKGLSMTRQPFYYHIPYKGKLFVFSYIVKGMGRLKQGQHTYYPPDSQFGEEQICGLETKHGDECYCWQKNYKSESFGAEGDYEPSFDSLEERIEWMRFAVNDKFLHQYEDDYSNVVLDIEEWNENNGNNSKLSNLVKQYKNKTGWMDAESFNPHVVQKSRKATRFTPSSKLRTGAFRTKEEAQEYRKLLKNKGHGKFGQSLRVVKANKYDPFMETFGKNAKGEYFRDWQAESFSAEECVSCDTPDGYWRGLPLCASSGEELCISCCACNMCRSKWNMLEVGEQKAESFRSYKVAPDLSSYTKAELVSSIAGPQGTAAYDEVVYDPVAQSRLSAESIDSFSPARLIVLGASIGVALGLYNTRRD